MAAAVSVCLVGAASGPSAHAVEGIIERSNGASKDKDEILDSLLTYGPFEIRPHVAGAVVYDDNIRISRTDQQEDVILNFAPGVLIGVGEYRSGGGTFLSLDYTPSFFVYAEHDENSTVDHAVTFAGQYAFTKLTLGLSQTYQASSGGLVEAGDRIDRRVYVTTLTSRYNYSHKTSFEVNFRQTISEFDGLAVSGYNEWVNQDWVNYALSDKVTVGVGATFGIRDVRGSANETFEQALVRAGYKLTEKVDVTASAGGEFRQFQGGESNDPAFVFSFGGVYRPRAGTELALEAFRQDQASVVARSQNFVATGVRGSIRQKMLRKFALGLGYGFQHASYRGTEAGVTTDREDEYWYVGPEVGCQINEHWNAGVFYQFRENTSNDSRFNFQNNQVGLRSAFRF